MSPIPRTMVTYSKTKRVTNIFSSDIALGIQQFCVKVSSHIRDALHHLTKLTTLASPLIPLEDLFTHKKT
jgi:hypothetical protein